MSQNCKIDGLIFCTPDEIDEAEYNSYIQEFLDANDKIIPTAAYRPEISFNEWQEKCRKESEGIDMEDDRVPATLYFLIQEHSNRILGAAHVRHRLNERLAKGPGNIGYGVRPSERLKGYATLMLNFAIEKCKELGLKKALISCHVGNIGSEKTILKCGGVLEGIGTDPDDAEQIKKYWINLE